jgi:hypothetical protein
MHPTPTSSLWPPWPALLRWGSRWQARHHELEHDKACRCSWMHCHVAMQVHRGFHERGELQCVHCPCGGIADRSANPTNLGAESTSVLGMGARVPTHVNSSLVPACACLPLRVVALVSFALLLWVCYESATGCVVTHRASVGCGWG